MIKKALIGVAAVAVLGGLVFGLDAVSYFRTAARSTQQAVKDTIPLEFKIQNARDMVQDLVPEVRKCMHVIAEEEVNVEDLTAEVARLEGNLGKQKEQILALRSDLDTGGKTFKYAGRTYSSDEVQRDLASRFERYKTAEDTLGSKKQILTARQRSLDAARQKLESMMAEKMKLEVQVENLDAQLKTLRAAETASSIVIDDSQLSRAKQLIADLNKQIEVKTRTLEKEGEITGVIPVEVEDEVPADLNQQIDEHFQKDDTSVPGKDL